VSKLLNINRVNFLTDNQAMANFLQLQWSIQPTTLEHQASHGYILGSYERPPV
jgi:hypothetical protein